LVAAAQCSARWGCAVACRFVVRWEMFVVMVMAMVIGASVVRVRAITAKVAGGVARLSGGVASRKHSAKRANGEIRFLKVCENHYKRAYHRGHDPPAGDRHLGRMAGAQMEPMNAAERFVRCLRRECWLGETLEMLTIAVGVWLRALTTSGAAHRVSVRGSLNWSYLTSIDSSSTTLSN
jgi:hypothetical protein